MQQIYLKRMTKQDITKSVAVCTESVQSFWDISLEATDEYTPIEVCHVSNPSYFPTGITIHKGYGGVKDWRICGENWKKLYANDNAEIGDIMFVRKLGNRCFSVEIIKKNSLNYSFLQSFFSGSDNYVILTTDNSNFQNIFNPPLPLQQIFYGAPGTGKSHTIKRVVEDGNLPHIRTTFHPDSDYSTFVGAYKPTMVEDTRYGLNGSNTVALTYPEGSLAGMPIKDKKIIYRFVIQAFTKAYLMAWKKLSENADSPQPQFLVIEEINRGNCAQIFGDLFQLLDRGDNGYSAYYIEADADMQQAIEQAFNDDEIDGKENKLYKLATNLDVDDVLDDYTSNYDATLSEDIQSGRVLLLPKNLYIWATMNTSDQSLFPIDSAFKRRWDWTYIPIKQHDEGYRIKIDTVTYDWWGFLEKINQVIGTTTSSEDKKLGYFFVKAENKEIGADKFVSKVLFYLWNDVFKNYGFDNPIFSRGENNKFDFSDFFKKDGTPETSIVNLFLRKLDETIDKDNSFENKPTAEAEPDQPAENEE